MSIIVEENRFLQIRPCRASDGRRESPSWLFAFPRESRGESIEKTKQGGFSPQPAWITCKNVHQLEHGCQELVGEIIYKSQIGELCKPPRLSPPSPSLDTDSQDSLCRVLSRHLLTSTMQGTGPGTRQVLFFDVSFNINLNPTVSKPLPLRSPL